MNRYSAQKQYWKAKQTKQDKEKIADVVLLQKLQVSRSEVPSSPEQTVLELGWVMTSRPLVLQILGCFAAWVEARTCPAFCRPQAVPLLSSVVSCHTTLPSPPHGPLATAPFSTGTPPVAVTS